VPLAAALGTCLVAFLILTALGVGETGSAQVPSTQPGGQHPLSPLQRYSEQAAQRAGAAGVSGARPAPDLVPLAPVAFQRPIARYRSYSRGQLQLMLVDLSALRRALRAGARGPAQVAWRAAYARYLRLGAVYGEFGTLDAAIDGSPGGLAQGVRDAHFTGLHRLEMGLWSHTPPTRLMDVERGLSENVRRLLDKLPIVQISPLDYSTRAHEILEDAQRDLLSGVDVPWSGEGVLATAAGLSATREVLATLAELLDGRENVIESVQSSLSRLGSTLSTIRAAHGGRWPTLAQLRTPQRELLNGVLGAALEALAGVPGALETRLPAPVASIPR
jgi:iron uptake system EfeUOB component EfeO/EfeM